jgi:alpha-1,2-mannosyltransferase
MTDELRSHRPYQLPIFLAIIHVTIRISLSNKAPITDCDEVYNYWEPLHFINYGSGMQTWEYAPQYALRTYAYLLPMSYVSSFYHVLIQHCPAFIIQALSKLLSPISATTATTVATTTTMQLFAENKALEFHLLRASIAFVTSITELYFIQTLASYYSTCIAFYTWILLLFSTGMFHTSPAYLPSCTVMICVFWSLSYQIQAWFCSKTYEVKGRTTITTDLMQRNLDKAIILGLIAILMTGWPFCAVLFIPLGVYATITTFVQHTARGDSGAIHTLHLFKRVLCYIICIQMMVMIVDYKYYEKIISPTWNIFVYNTGFFAQLDNDNAAGMIGRDELYGVEDASYYIKNLILNWNIASILGVFALPFVILRWFVKRNLFTNNSENSKNDDWEKKREIQMHILVLLPMILWMGIVFPRPHKEERFLFPIYPMLALGTAIVIDQVLEMTCIHKLVYNILNGKGLSFRDKEENATKIFMKVICGAFLLAPIAMISISRSMVLADGYTAPLKVYTHLHNYMLNEQAHEMIKGGSTSSASSSVPKIVCTGGEWYRFPSSYHLPGNTQLAFLKSSFLGQLPQQFSKYGSKEESLKVQHGQFNELNNEELDRYVDIAECSYLIDVLDVAHCEDGDGDISACSKYVQMDRKQWAQIASYKFLDAENTPLLHRVLFVPYLRRSKYQEYALFERL